MKKNKLYNCEFTNYDYLKENESRIINLEYYSILNEEKELYGIEICKKEKSNLGNENIEKNIVIDYTNDKEKIDNLIKCLFENKVTPILLQDIIRDIENAKDI